jgi:hypothetical protein
MNRASLNGICERNVEVELPVGQSCHFEREPTGSIVRPQNPRKVSRNGAKNVCLVEKSSRPKRSALEKEDIGIPILYRCSEDPGTMM